MPTYVTLVHWTDQGVKNAKDTVARYRDARATFERQGVRFQSIHWTTGPFDAIAVIEAPDDQAVSVAALKLAGQGNVRTETFRAFGEQEMEQIIKKLS